jgi:peptidoglycan/xylan/chitin deacetylase (PgdA/CDA1 family)
MHGRRRSSPRLSRMRNGLPLLDRIATRWVREFPGPRTPIAPTRPILSLAFDDVPDSALINGARILEAHDARGTFYAAGGLAGRQEAERTLLAADGYAALARRGHEIGCHTFSHVSVRRLSARQLAEDLDRNARYLAGVPGTVVARNFAFPYTVAAPQARRTLARRFRSCRGGHAGINRGSIDRGYLRSVEIRRTTPLDVLNGWINDLASDSGWLIFFTHDVSPEPTEFGCTPETLDRLIGHARERGCAVLTVDAALDALGIAAAIEAAQWR